MRASLSLTVFTSLTALAAPIIDKGQALSQREVGTEDIWQWVKIDSAGDNAAPASKREVGTEDIWQWVKIDSAGDNAATPSKRDISTEDIWQWVKIDSEGNNAKRDIWQWVKIDSEDGGVESESAGEAKRATISPYADDIAAADPHKVLGE